MENNNTTIITYDKGFSDFTHKIDKTTGFLKVNGNLSRDGIQEYLGIELSKDLEPYKVYNVLRPTSEVLNKESLDSFINAPVTDDHPNTSVTVDNVQDLLKGSTSNIEVIKVGDNNIVKGQLSIVDKVLINKILDGKVEISVGYSQVLVQEDGDYNGVPYQFKQTQIDVNHVAIVEKGRCGDKCKITNDNKVIISDVNIIERVNMTAIKIGDAEIQVCDTVLAHINSLTKAVKDGLDNIKNLDADIEKVTAEKDMLEEEAKVSKDAPNIEELVSQKVQEIVSLLSTAKEAEVEVPMEQMADSMLIKKSVISKVSGVTLDGKSNAYIDACFDMAKEKLTADAKKVTDVNQSIKDAQEGFKPNGNQPTKSEDARVSARDAYINKMTGVK